MSGAVGMRILESRRDQTKRESYAMALKLMTQYRISIEMAAWSLKHSGYSREEIDCFIEELIKGINNAP